MAFDRDLIRQVKTRVDMVEIIRRYVELRPASGRWMGPCPFHQETKGSFSVSPDKGFYYCFGCQATGDVIDFYGRINGLEFREALESLAKEAGVEITYGPADPKADEKRRKRQACFAMHTLAAEYFSSVLAGRGGKTARRYLERRGTAPEVCEKFSLGASDENWQGLLDFLRRKGFSPEDGADAGLLSKSDKGRFYDRFRARLIFPIQDVAGRVIAFGGRVMGEGEPKYLNSSDSPIYKKGEHLYGLHQARPVITKARSALLTEGYMDVIALHQFGFENAVGVLGTALTEDQVRRLAGFCKQVDLVFDGDPPGRKAALKSAEMILAQGVSCRVVLLPDGKDVDDLLQAEGAAGFTACREDAREGLDFCCREMRATASAREVVEWARGFVKGLKEPSYTAYYLPRLAEGLKLDEAMLRKALSGDSPPAPAARSGSDGRVKPGRSTRHAESGGMRDREILGFLIRHPEYLDEARSLEADAALGTELCRSLWEKIELYGMSDVFSQLDGKERLFFAEQDTAGEAEDDEKKREQWKDISAYLETAVSRERLKNLQEALREAKVRGDVQEVRRLCEAYNAELLGRVDEQP